MIRVMLDTDVLDRLTEHVELLATYADLVPEIEVLRAKYPHSQVLLIDRGLGDPENEASVIDVERGAYNPSHVPEWLDHKERSGIEYRTVYCNRGNLAAVDQAGANRTFYRWIATLDGTVHIDGFAPLEAPTAVQFASSAALSDHADLSLVFDEGWNRPHVPAWLRESRDLAAAINHNSALIDRDVQDLVIMLTAAR